MSDLKQLRDANIARNNEWPGSEKIDLTFRGLEHAGECAELAENVMSLALLAGRVSVKSGKVCNAAKKITRITSGIAAPKGSKPVEQLRQELIEEIIAEAGDVLITLDLLCMSLGINLAEATQVKFNKTSDKVGLETELWLDSALTKRARI